MDNYNRDRFIFAQYFGSTSGLLRYYPAYYWEDVNNEVRYSTIGATDRSYNPGLVLLLSTEVIVYSPNL